MTRSPLTIMQMKIKRFVQTRIWGMDIAPSAWIEPTALIDRTWPKGIHIGKDTYISHQAVVLTHDFTRNIHQETWIGKRCYIGARAIILPGVTIGDDCVIEPGTLVNKTMPANTFAIGNPAELRQRGP